MRYGRYIVTELHRKENGKHKGYVFVLDLNQNQYIRRPEKRIRLFGLADSGHIINVLTPNADLASAKYIISQDKVLVITDEKTFSLEINEFGSTR